MEKAVVVLDCRASFSPFFESAKTALQTFVHEKLIHKPNHEVGIVIFGCDTTSNPLFDGTDGDAYEHVTVVQSLETVGVDLLKTLQQLPPPTMGSDKGSMDAAVRVAGEVLRTTTEQKKKAAKQRIVVLSTFESGEGGVAKSTIEQLADASILFTLIHCMHDEEQARCASDHWAWELGKSVQVKPVHTLYQLRTCFPIKENKDAHTLYSHTMKLGNSLEIPVKVILKLKKEPFPSLGNASHLATETDVQESAAPWPYQSAGGVAVAGYYREDDIRQEYPIEVEDRVRGFRFSRSIVPMSDPLVDLSKITPERGIQIIGFMAKKAISCVSCMGTSKILCADKSSSKAAGALSSLAHAMVQEEQVALIRMVLRAGASVKLAIGIGVADNPGYLILKEVPYAEDVSSLAMTPASSLDQDTASAALHFVDSNMLEESEMDLERIANPVLHRAMSFFTQRFVEPGAVIPGTDVWLRPVFGNNYKSQ
ncbi:ATP-dependent DNA helicase 2 subunit KU80 [Picochlorum sp. SENEW3]|nr:ATP-dependent DNA helicase 2 subunit KU80 [Picochlorum sp. SENEW3]